MVHSRRELGPSRTAVNMNQVVGARSTFTSDTRAAAGIFFIAGLATGHSLRGVEESFSRVGCLKKSSATCSTRMNAVSLSGKPLARLNSTAGQYAVISDCLNQNPARPAQPLTRFLLRRCNKPRQQNIWKTIPAMAM